MDIVEDVFGLRFIKVQESNVFLGTDKGGWVYANERPRHRVELPSYLILEKPISKSQYAAIMGEKDSSDEPKDMITHEDIALLCSKLSSHFDGEVRRPTQSAVSYTHLTLPTILLV